VETGLKKKRLSLSCFFELHDTHAATRFSGFNISPPLATGST